MSNLVKFKLNTEQLEKAFRDLKNIKWNDVSRLGGENAKKALKEDIVSTIERGNSPVKGERRFVDYSDSYKAQISAGRLQTYNKKLRPVNLTLSGKMLRSIKGRVNNNGISIWFSSGIAKYHNEMGAGKSKTIRRMLPKDNEQFKKAVTLRASEIVASAYEKAIETKLK